MSEFWYETPGDASYQDCYTWTPVTTGDDGLPIEVPSAPDDTAPDQA